MFKEILQQVVEGAEGSMAALLMDFDGIPVERYVKHEGGIDVETVGMEYSVILKNIRNAAQMLEAGPAKEVSIRAEGMTTVIRMITNEYFVAVTLSPKASPGKVRYLLRTKAESLRSQLE